MEGGCIWKGITYVTATGFKFTETLDIASVSSMEFLDIQTSKKRMWHDKNRQSVSLMNACWVKQSVFHRVLNAVSGFVFS